MANWSSYNFQTKTGYCSAPIDCMLDSGQRSAPIDCMLDSGQRSAPIDCMLDSGHCPLIKPLNKGTIIA